MDLLELRRLLTALVMPLPFGLGLAIGAGGLALLLRRRPRGRRWACLMAASGILLLWIAAMPWTAGWLMRSLESPYPPRPAAECGGAIDVDAIVVLGGAVSPQLGGDARARLHRGSDRIREAALLYHAGCAPQLLVSAGGGVQAPAIRSEADAIRALLLELGVPEAATIIEDQSRSTAENARYSAALLDKDGKAPRILLVTSAWHLRRATPLFRNAGFDVVPVGSDYRSLARCSGLSCLFPDTGALDASSAAWKEHLGYWIQISRG